MNVSELIARCGTCTTAREALEAFKHAMMRNSVEVLGTPTNNKDKLPAAILNTNSFVIKCDVCGDTQVVLTAEGKQLAHAISRVNGNCQLAAVCAALPENVEDAEQVAF